MLIAGGVLAAGALAGRRVRGHPPAPGGRRRLTGSPSGPPAPEHPARAPRPCRTEVDAVGRSAGRACTPLLWSPPSRWAAATGAGLVSAGLGTTSASPPQPGVSAAPATERPGTAGPALPAPRRCGSPSRASASTPRSSRSPPTRTARWRCRPWNARRSPAGTTPVPPPVRPATRCWSGHVDSQHGPAVFFDLGGCAAATIRVLRADGRTATFTVDGVGAYPKERFPTARVYGGDAAARLRLITCGGRFDPRTGSYPDNIVVFATATR
ncbi:sortase [Micromonospora sp. BRA006-A]|nr:sortase [Micromonospora sp. BRA006-A]